MNKENHNFFMIYIEGKNAPKKKYVDYQLAVDDATELVKKEQVRAFILQPLQVLTPNFSIDIQDCSDNNATAF